jgi:hypothetical protein
VEVSGSSARGSSASCEAADGLDSTGETASTSVGRGAVEGCAASSAADGSPSDQSFAARVDRSADSPVEIGEVDGMGGTDAGSSPIVRTTYSDGDDTSRPSSADGGAMEMPRMAVK